MPVSTRISVVSCGAGNGILRKYCGYAIEESDIASRTIHEGSEVFAQKTVMGKNRSMIVDFEICV